MKVLLAHPGTQYSGKLASQLFLNGALSEFYTGFAIADGGIGDHLLAALPNSWRRRLANRRIAGLPSSLLHVHPWDEALAMLQQKMGRPQQSVLHARNARFQERIPDIAIAQATAVIGFDTSGWILAQRCARLCRPFVLDQSIGHPDAKSQVFERLRARYPDWATGAEHRLKTVRDAECIEHDLARRIVVPSTFARNTLVENGVSPDKIRVNPFGVDCAQFLPRPTEIRRPLRFCFAGSISVRKGVPLLLEAWNDLRPANAELWLIGPASAANAKIIQGYRNVCYKGAVPHNELPRLLAQCDVFVFPSFFEGFAQVIPEAMACGLPVIATTSAGADILQSGKNGWVLEPGDATGLREAMDYCLMNSNKLPEAGIEARRAAEQLTWGRYGARWMQILGELSPPDAAS